MKRPIRYLAADADALRRQMHQLLDAKAVIDKHGAAAREYAALGQTQDIAAIWGGLPAQGVYVVIRDPEAPVGSLMTMQSAPELSMASHIQD